MKSLAFGSLVLVLALFIAGCNKPPDGDSRYTLSKDASGRTIRLDKQTGEIAIVDGMEIKPLKNAAQATAERAAKAKELEEPKSWPDVDIPQIGARASLSTAWRDGKMFYSFGVFDLAQAKEFEAWLALTREQRQGKSPPSNPKRRDQVLRKAVAHIPFDVKFEDANGFRVTAFTVGALTRIVDDNSLTQYYEEKHSLTLTEEDYRRLDHWNVYWH